MKMRTVFLLICLVLWPFSWAGASDNLDQSRPVVSGTVDHLNPAGRTVLISDRHYTFAEVVRLNGRLVSGATVPSILREGMEVDLQLQQGTQSVISVLNHR